MKRLATILVLILNICPPRPVDAGCRVACRQQAVQGQFVALATEIPIGVPVGQYGATTYSYDARPVNVTVNLNTDDVAQAITESLLGQASHAPPVPPAAPHIPSAAAAPSSAVVTQCAKCHAAGANAFTRFDAGNLAGLSCEQRLAAARAVLSERMPKGHKLTAEEAGDVLSELIGK